MYNCYDWVLSSCYAETVPLDSIGFQTCLEKPPRIIGCLTNEMFPQHKRFEELGKVGRHSLLPLAGPIVTVGA